MEQLSTTLSRLKGLRESMEITVEDMAEASSVSPVEYLEIENGDKDLSFTFLFKCATRMGVDISSIVTGDEPRLTSYTLSKQGDGMPIKRREGFDYTHISYLLKDRLAEPFVVTAKYADKDQDKPVPLSNHSGQELNYILEGELKFQLEDHTEYLKAGDSVYYDAKKRHGMIAIGGKDCKFLSVVIKGDVSENTMPMFSVDNVDEVSATDESDTRIYKNFVTETFDKKGHLADIKFNYPDNFNFAYDVVDVLAEKIPNKTAMLWVSGDGLTEHKFTYSEMSKLSNKAANYFTSLGIKKGDKVMLVLRRHYQFWISMMALHKIGAVAIPATDLLTTHDFEYRFTAADVSAVVATGFGHVSDMIDESEPNAPTLKLKIMAKGKKDGWHDFDAEFEGFSDEFERVDTIATDPMLMYFTSGTTGYPKIATHCFTYPLGHIVTARWWHNTDAEGLHFAVSDTGWGKAVWGKLYGQWLAESGVFTYDFEKFTPVDILPMFAKYNITTFCAPPTIFRFFIKEDLTKFDLSSLQYATIAGEALNPEVYYQFESATGIKLMEGFGQTETTLVIANLIGMEPKPGAMGKPTPAYDIKLMLGDGTIAKSGEVGEIVINVADGCPPGVFTGYYKNQVKTDEVWYDGYYHTGDMAWQDEDGYMWYVGRTDDLIKSSGYRIGPFEIESVLMEIPSVMECAVTGVPDDIRGQVVKATIVLAAGYEPSEELKKEIQTYVKVNTAPYKYPRVVEFVTELPKTISGKIRRVEIRDKK